MANFDVVHNTVLEQKSALQQFLEDTLKLKGVDASKVKLAAGFELRNGEIWAHYDLIRLSELDGGMLIEYELKGQVLHMEMGPPMTGFRGALEIIDVDGWVKLDLGVMGG